MTPFQILTLFVGSATWFTAFIGLLSLLTLRRQQKAIIQPQLTPVKQYIFARRSVEPAGQFMWTESVPEQDADVQQPFQIDEGTWMSRSSERYVVRIFNLGSGAAKNISATWSVAIPELVDSINRIAHKSSIDSYQEYDEKKQTLSFRSKTFTGFFFLKNDLVRHQDYILPCSIENRGHDFELPGAFVKLVSEYVSVMFSNEEASWDEFQKLTQLTLLLSFDDLANNHHSAKHCFKIELEGISRSTFTAMLTPTRA
jgi:hypothetical protein